MKTVALFCLGCAAVAAALAAPTPAPVRAEIDALLLRLETSGCDLSRNGTWHKPTEARAHLVRKLEYLEGKTTLRSTEQFIELAASSSSASGKPYLVKCGAAAAQLSAQWLNAQLAVMRGAARAASAPK